MELLSPAGNIEKLSYCYTYGADAAYIGLKKFSLRVKADNFYEDEYKRIIELKNKFPGKKLHCALNIAFHNAEIDSFIKEIPYFKQYPIDAFIVQDLGIVPLLQKNFPNATLHLSTQASCMNREAVKMYKSLGFKRVVMGREASLAEIKEIKDAVPDMEIECFVHGAMCIAYSGRCLMSAYLNGRSGQSGFCSHTCRWDYDLLVDRNQIPQTRIDCNDSVAPNEHDSYSAESRAIAQSGALVLREHKRPDEYFPVYEGDNFTAILSSKDLCMIDHLADLKKAGVDSLKIEGRMKSVYYVALITRAYRKALDALDGKITDEQAKPFVSELYDASHREYATGFYYDKEAADVTVTGASDSPYYLAATVGSKLSPDESQKLLSKAEHLASVKKQKYDSLCDEAKRAADKAAVEHPDKYLPTVQRREGWSMIAITALNMLNEKSALELVTPDIAAMKMSHDDYELVNPETGELYRWVCDSHPCVLYTKLPVCEGALIRAKDPDFVLGQVRDTGR
jgi:putative protease